MSISFKKNIIIPTEITVATGLHIGGTKERLEIGGVDSPIIRDPKTNYPILPASSIKGRLRSLLEYHSGKLIDKNPHSSDEINDEINRLFGGFKENTNGGPTRLIIRDALPSKKTIKMWKQLSSESLYAEVKAENSINRISSEANPRFIERVVAESSFETTLILGVYEVPNLDKPDEDLLDSLITAFKLLIHSGLGGNISRGYGQVTLKFQVPKIVSKQDYANIDKDISSLTTDDGGYNYNIEKLAEWVKEGKAKK